MDNYIVRYSDADFPPALYELFETVEAALARLEQLAQDGRRDTTLWKRLDVKLSTKARLSTRIRATKSSPAPAQAPATSPLGPGQEAAGGVVVVGMNGPLRREEQHEEACARLVADLKALGADGVSLGHGPVTPDPLGCPFICETPACLKDGSHAITLPTKSPFIRADDPILLAHFCGLHAEVKPTSILWEWHRDFIERSGGALATARLEQRG